MIRSNAKKSLFFGIAGFFAAGVLATGIAGFVFNSGETYGEGTITVGGATATTKE